MISAEGETVKFAKKVVPAHARGLVEKWLLQVKMFSKTHLTRRYFEMRRILLWSLPY